MKKKYWNLSLASVAVTVVFFAALIVISEASKPAPQPPLPPAPADEIVQDEAAFIPAEKPDQLQEKLPDTPPVAVIVQENPSPVLKTGNMLKIVPAASGNARNIVEFLKNGKKAFDLQFKDFHTPGAMIPASVSTDTQSYCFQEFTGTEIDCQKFALDIKGDKNSQYMIAVNKNDNDYEGFLIDLNKGIVLGKVPVADTVEYPINNPDLVFEYSEVIVPGDAEQASVCLKVKLMLRENQEPLCVSQAQTAFDLEKYKNIPTTQKERDIHLARLYCELANAGMIRYAIHYARSIGYSDAEVLQNGGNVLDLIRSSELYPYIKKLNNNLP